MLSGLYRLILIGWLLLCGRTVLCQMPDYHVRLFDESFGIRNDMEKVIMDTHDFIWLATYDRIFRFDGKKTIEFPGQEHVSSMLCDAHGQVWTNSEDKIRIFKNDREGFVKVDFDTSGHNRLGRFFILPGREICLYTSRGIFEWSPNEKKFIRWSNSEFNIPSVLYSGYFSQFGTTLFFSGHDTLYALDTRTKTSLIYPWAGESGRIFAISDHEALMTQRGNNTIWLDYAQRSTSRVEMDSTVNGGMKDFFYVQDVLPITDNEILIASHGGLLELNKSERKFKPVLLYNRGLPIFATPYFYDLFQDRNKKLWLMHLRGLISFSPQDETIGLIRGVETGGNNYWQNNVRNFAEDENGNLWISTSLGFGHWDLKTNQMKIFLPKAGATDQLDQPSVRGLYYDQPNLIMGTASSGLWIYNSVTGKYRRPDYGRGEEGLKLKALLEKEFVKQIVQLPDSNFFVVARKCYILKRNTYAISEFKIDAWTKNQPSVYYLGEDGNIWLGTEDGVLNFDRQLNFLHYWKLNQSIMTLHEFTDHDWVIGTTTGLYKVNFINDTFNIERDKDLPAMSWTSFIVTDRHHDFWIGSKEGLYRFNPRTKQVDEFDYTDNTLGNNFAPQPLFSKEGTLYIGGLNGLNYFHPERIKSPHDSLQVTITKVTVNQNDSSYYDRVQLLDLTPKQNTIEIEYIAPYYRNTEHVHYRYQLQGLTSGWTDAGSSNLIRFTSLPPGHYQFRIASSINGINWFEGKEILAWSIAYPVWQRWWFITIAALLFLFILYYFLARRIEAAKEKEKVKRQYEKRIAEVEMHALRAQMNPHFMFNSLNSINNFILKNDPDNASGYLTKFSRLMRLILDNSRSEWIVLESELKALELYIQLEVVRFDDAFEYELIVDPNVDITTTYVPPMIIQPYVENAIWHGLLHRHMPGGKLSIRIWREGEVLHINVEDNGVGRTEAARLKSKSATKHKSHGLKITAERMDIVNRIYNVNAHVDIVDLQGQNGSSGGTRVSLTLQDKLYDSHHRG